jgi:phage N-6-adenine-methyltransferase
MPYAAAPLLSSAKADWCTPQVVLHIVYQFGPVALDPCASREGLVIAREMFFGPPDGVDGLRASWTRSGPGVVFCNPPYGRGIDAWMLKARSEVRDQGAEVVALVPARPDTRWWRDYCAPPRSDAVCFWHGRLTFEGAPSPAPFPSALVYWGPRRYRFADVFARVGSIWL